MDNLAKKGKKGFVPQVKDGIIVQIATFLFHNPEPQSQESEWRASKIEHTHPGFGKESV